MAYVYLYWYHIDKHMGSLKKVLWSWGIWFGYPNIRVLTWCKIKKNNNPLLVFKLGIREVFIKNSNNNSVCVYNIYVIFINLLILSKGVP